METQRNYTKDRIREIYRAMLKFIDTCRYYYYELDIPMEASMDNEVMDIVHRANSELRRLFNDIVELLENAMLDIPEETYEQIHEYIWMDLEEYIDLNANLNQREDYKYFENNPMDRHYIEECDQYMQAFFKGGYLKELRALFKDYIVKSKDHIAGR